MAESVSANPMRPPPSLASYLKNMGNDVQQQRASSEAAPSVEQQQRGSVPPSAVMATAQRELQKFKSLQERRAQVTQELQSLDMQLTKIQGALEVFHAMGILKQG
jgi:hypothetical protein